MAPKKKPRPAERTVATAVEEILSDPRVLWFPVKHFSPACAFHVRRLILEERPVGVLVEGPQDATGLIPYMVHPDTQCPFTIFSTYVDKDNDFGLNGVLSASESVPARYRAWWPMTDHAPEYAALKAGHEVGAKLEFCDAPLVATIPYHHVPRREATQTVDDAQLATNDYFEAVRRAQRRRSFEEFWNASFEVAGARMDTRTFRRNALAFAFCARMSTLGLDPSGDPASPHPGLEADGTLLREGHMRWCLDTFLKENPTGKVVVVTGAWHSVALPFTKKNRAKAKPDKNLETLLTPHSFQALATLYGLNRLPAYQQLVWEGLAAGAEEPFNAAALRVLLEVMRRARGAKEGVSTADAVGAWRVARNLATLRGNAEVTLEDLTDAVQLGYIKGDVRLKGAVVEKCAREVLVGQRQGRVTAEAGQPPLIRDFYGQCKIHKIDTSGESKVVRCNLGRQEGHRAKSAFLHQASFLEVPMFKHLDDGGPSWWLSSTGAPGPTSSMPGYFKGPDLATGADLHLLGETWGVQWHEKVDGRLLELSDRGASLGHACVSFLREKLVTARGNAGETTRLLLRSAQMALPDLFDELLTAVEEAVAVDSRLESLVKALHDFVMLYGYRDALATAGNVRVLATIRALYHKAAFTLPASGGASGETLKPVLDAVQTLVRITLTFEDLDRQLLLDQLFAMVKDPGATAVLRGAGYGILFSFGATREKVVARELEGYLRGGPGRVLESGAVLDGLFLSSKSIFLGSPRLLRSVHAVLRELDWETFKLLLPDLRRAFTQFIPSEIDKISDAVSEEVGLTAPPAEVPIPAGLVQVTAAADARVAAVLDGWL